jgi:hypothetical protein
MRVPAGEVEGLVLDQIRQLIGSPPQLAEVLLPLDLTAGELDLRIRRAKSLATEWLSMPSESQRELVRQILSRVTLSIDQITLSIGLASLDTLLGGRSARAMTTEPVLTLQIPATAEATGKGKRMIIGETQANTVDPSLVRLIHEAFAIRSVVVADTRETLNEITARRKKSKGYLTSLMRLSYLAPSIIDDILNGRQPPRLSAKHLLRTSSTLPLAWGAQRAHLRFV